MKEFNLATPGEAEFDDRPVGGGFLREIQHFGSILSDVVMRTTQTNAMIFGIFIGATLFSYIFRALGGDDLTVTAVAEGRDVAESIHIFLSEG